MLLLVDFQRGPTLGVLQAAASTSKAAVFQVFKHRSSLSQTLQPQSRIQTLQQSFTYPPNLVADFHVSKPCSRSLSRIQFLASSSLEDVPQVCQITGD